MKVLFIGGTGTISAAISEALLKEGHELLSYTETVLHYGRCDNVIQAINHAKEFLKK